LLERFTPISITLTHLGPNCPQRGFCGLVLQC